MKFGYKIDTSSGRETAKSLNFLMADVEGKKEQNVLTQLAIRSMAKAVYTTKKHSHYGLAFDYYTHFTSPIRRYPDVMVHRLLELYLAGGKSVTEEEYEKLSIHSSKMEKKAAEAERASVKYKQAEFLQSNIGNEYSGIISGLTEWGMYVELIESKCEGMVRYNNNYTVDAENYIVFPKMGGSIRLGDEIKVTVKSVDLDIKQIDA
jgi:ribonuclease R